MSTRWNNQQYNMCYHWWGSCFKLLVLYVGWPWNYASRVVIPMPPFPIASFSCPGLYIHFSKTLSRAIYSSTEKSRNIMGKLHGKKDQYEKVGGLRHDWSSSMGLSVVHIKELERVERSISAYSIRCVCYLHLFPRTTNSSSLSIASSALILSSLYLNLIIILIQYLKWQVAIAIFLRVVITIIHPIWWRNRYGLATRRRQVADVNVYARLMMVCKVHN